MCQRYILVSHNGNQWSIYWWTKIWNDTYVIILKGIVLADMLAGFVFGPGLIFKGVTVVRGEKKREKSENQGGWKIPQYTEISGNYSKIIYCRG